MGSSRTQITEAPTEAGGHVDGRGRHGRARGVGVDGSVGCGLDYQPGNIVYLSGKRFGPCTR